MRLPELMGARPACKLHDLPLVRRVINGPLGPPYLGQGEYFEWICPDERHERPLDTWESFTLGVDWPRKKRRMPES